MSAVDPPKKAEDAVSTQRAITVSSEVYSFFLFALLPLSGIALFPFAYPVFLVILVVDALATVINSDILVELDMSALFLFFVVVSVTVGPNLFVLFLEILLVVAALDFTFFLRKLRSTLVDGSVLRKRLGSYALTVVPAFLISYALAFLYSFLPEAALKDPLAILVVSTTTALFAVYVLSRYLSGPSSAQAADKPSSSGA